MSGSAQLYMTETPSEAPPARAPKITDLMHGRLALTPVTVLLVCVNLSVFGVMLFYGGGFWHSPNDVQVAWGAGFGPATKDGEWWRLASAMFLHFGLVHLVMNMVALVEAGRLVERLYGSGRFVVIYFASGLTGNLASLIVQGDQAIAGGASGAVFGVYGALLVCLWRERCQVDVTEFRWLFGGAALFTAVTIALGLFITGIDNAAHIGGLLSGALVGAVLARRLSADSPAHNRSRWVAAIVHGLAVLVLLYRIPAPTYSWQEEKHAREEIRQFLADDKRIMERWQNILNKSRQTGASFEQLAGEVESEIASEYRQHLEQLSALDLDPAAPSSTTVEILRKYSQLRSEASQALAEGLRDNNRRRIREALEMARRAPFVARGQEPPAPVAGAGSPPRSVLDLYGNKPQIDFGQRMEKPVGPSTK